MSEVPSLSHSTVTAEIPSGCGRNEEISKALLTNTEAASIRQAFATQVKLDPYYDKAPLGEADHDAMHAIIVQAGRELDPLAARVRTLGALVRAELALLIQNSADHDAALQLCSYLVDTFCAGLQVGRDAEEASVLDSPHCSSLLWHLRVEANQQAEGLANAA